MARVHLADIDRPGLVAALAERGIATDSRAPLPGRPGLALISRLDDPARITQLRAEHRGILMLLVEPREPAMIAALDGGADDVLPHSSSDALIAARLAALLRRSGAAAIEIGELVVDRLERSAHRAGRRLALRDREFRLLLALAQSAGRTVPRIDLLRHVCGLRFDPGTNVLDVHVARLRAALDRGFAVPMLLTDKGRGYRLVDPQIERRIEHEIGVAAAPAGR